MALHSLMANPTATVIITAKALTIPIIILLNRPKRLSIDAKRLFISGRRTLILLFTLSKRFSMLLCHYWFMESASTISGSDVLGVLSTPKTRDGIRKAPIKKVITNHLNFSTFFLRYLIHIVITSIKFKNQVIICKRVVKYHQPSSASVGPCMRAGLRAKQFQSFSSAAKGSMFSSEYFASINSSSRPSLSRM